MIEVNRWIYIYDSSARMKMIKERKRLYGLLAMYGNNFEPRELAAINQQIADLTRKLNIKR